MYVFLIDTDAYAGNFERELCAYMTGMVGDCEVGDTIAESVEGDLIHRDWYLNNVESVSDDRGCYRPCQIELNPAQGNQYNSVGINMVAVPPADVVDELKARAAAYLAADGTATNITGFRFRVVTVTTTEGAI